MMINVYCFVLDCLHRLGTLVTAKKYGIVQYEGDLLLQRVHDKTIVTLIKVCVCAVSIILFWDSLISSLWLLQHHYHLCMCESLFGCCHSIKFNLISCLWSPVCLMMTGQNEIDSGFVTVVNRAPSKKALEKQPSTTSVSVFALLFFVVCLLCFEGSSSFFMFLCSPVVLDGE